MADTDAPTKTANPSSDDRIQVFAKWDRLIDHHWSEWRKEARQAFDLVAGRQWEPAEKERLEAMDRVAPVFNKLAPLIDAVSGAEIMGRQEVRYYPRQVGSSAKNEILTKGAAWIRDRCDADQEESEAFRNSFTCGLGWTETALEHDEEPEGQIGVSSIDPLEMTADPSAKRNNLTDARYLRRRKAMNEDAYCEAFPAYADLASEPSPYSFKTLIVNNPRTRYEGTNDSADDIDTPEEGEIMIDEYQWFELEPYWRMSDPETGEHLDMTQEDYEDVRAEMEAYNMQIDAVQLRRRRYWRAFVCGNTLLGDPEELVDGEFTYKAITGKRDRNKRQWYGLVRPMTDPQKWLNQFLSQLLAIMAASTKGGVLHEEGAIEDTAAFDKTWAAFGGRTVVRAGALSGNEIQQKQATPYPNGIDRLLTIASDALRESTGVNPELLGMVDREQAGVLEHQRKQAAYGILSVYFDNFRRYRRIQGRLLLKIIKYLPADYLVRIVGDDGLAKYVPLLKGDEDLEKFDVIVDEAPAGPNQKTQVWGMIIQLMPYLKDTIPQNSPFWSEVIKYTPFPDDLATKMSEALAQPDAPDPAAQAAAAAGVRKTTSEANKNEATAVKTALEAQRLARMEAIEEMASRAGQLAEQGVIFPPDHQPFGA